MKLNISDRLTLLQILPSEGDIVTIKVVKDLNDNLGFTEKEIEDYSIVVNGSTINWDEKKAEEKEIEIGPKALSIIVSALEKMNQEKKLTISYLPVYEKFMKV